MLRLHGDREGDDVGTVAVQPAIVELLEQAGAKPRGNRHDCPKCGGYRTVTHSSEAFFCHKCGWKGNTVSLAKELGVYQRLPKAEFVRQVWKRERAHEAALRLYGAVHSQRRKPLDMLHDLNRLEAVAHDAGPTESGWGNLALVYQHRPKIESELDFLESATAAGLAEFLKRSDTGSELPAEMRGTFVNERGLLVSDDDLPEGM